MANDRKKIVQNYSLEEMKQVYLNETQIWTVLHITQKKMFTLKRIRCRSNLNSPDSKKQPVLTQPKDQYQKLVSQSNLLKRLNAQFAPKCYKTIKTSHNAYIIYQQYPSQTLQHHLTNQPLNAHQRKQLLQNLANTVLQVHKKDIVMLGLNLNNIYLREKYQVFFGDWTLSKNTVSNEKILLTNAQLNSQFIANEVKQHGTFNIRSDIYSLGKIFKAIQNKSLLQPMDSTRKRLQNLIKQMLSKNYNERPSIEEILVALGKKVNQVESSQNIHVQKEKIQESKISAQMKIMKRNTLEQQETERQEDMGKSQLKSVKSATILLSQKRMELAKNSDFQIRFSQKSATSKIIPKTEASSKSIRKSSGLAFMQEPIRVSHNSNNSQIRNSSRGWQGNQQLFKSINKKRHLSFILIDLAEFVLRTDLSPELGYLLLKYSMLISKQNLQKWRMQKNSSSQHWAFCDILQKQLASIQQVIFALTQQLKQLITTKQPLKRQVDLSHVINDKYMKEMIVQFSKEIVIICQKSQVQKILSAKLIDILFKTYLILKKVEEGSYEKFWQKASNEDFIYLSNQKYLKQQKNLGFRYLKSRIAQILSKK